MAIKKSTPSYAAPALSRGLEILEYLAAIDGPVGQADLSRELGRKSGEQFRFLHVLEKEGYIARDASGGYSLTLKLYCLASMTKPNQMLVDSARKPMRDYSQKYGHECHLCILDGGRLIVIANESGTGPIGLEVKSGSVHDPRATTAGRLHLANLSSEDLDWHLKRAAALFPPPNANVKKFYSNLVSVGDRFVDTKNERWPSVRDLAVYLPGGALCPPSVLGSACMFSSDERNVSEVRAGLLATAKKIMGTEANR